MRRKETPPEKGKVELEQLLRIKRAERPDDRFWEQFDRDLHQRMMQALVRKDPLAVQLLRGLTGRFAQLGAVAVLLVALGLFAAHALSPGGGTGATAGAAKPVAGVAADPVEDWVNAADSRDFGVRVLSAAAAAVAEPAAPGVRRDFEAAPRLELAAYEPAAYAVDLASPPDGVHHERRVVY